MSISSFRRDMVSVCAATAILAGCGGLQTATPPTEQLTNLSLAYPLTSGYKSLFSFNGADGAFPVAALIAVNGALYGTTSLGGKYDSGTVFRMSMTGTNERVLHSFNYNGKDGFIPSAGLIALKGAFYGTTYGSFGSSGECDSYGCGTVFEVRTSGKERVLYRFKGGTGGFAPSAGLIVVNGALYGTTAYGGTPGGSFGYGCGTVFEVSTSGKGRIVYRFKCEPDGGEPQAGLIDVSGTLYGTTSSGGTYCTGGYGAGCGTVFEVSTSGNEHVLYSFSDTPDGAYPFAGLTDVNGALYGTTYPGGTGCKNGGFGPGCGTVFEVSTSGKERVLYRFKGGTDGKYPFAGLTDVNGTLYGTTYAGGTGCKNGSYGSGCGTVFEVSTSGKERVLYRFKGGTDGYYPRAGLIAVNGALYGTTSRGGTSDYHYGTVFRITP